ncbi:DUF883 family protein [Sphingomonas sp. 2R-10]|uniref:DUF883 family protein n=1 Tax=Sphingomonas sp. 2R-10 TaxID=3045148 RepID=UPI000F775D9D|nr:DUF883 family protein [Sphingomonas sp. 2R-10]MDJ0278080.1 DUF883 family protein [Sphingomonas sp. 2R-10]
MSELKNAPTATTTNPGTIDTIRDKASTAAHATSDAAHDAAKRASDAAHDAARAASDTIETSPLAVLAGGLALGAVLGALLPRTAQETKALAPLGKKLSAAATAAAATARDVGKEQLTAALPSKDGAKEQLRTVFSNVVQAATDSGKSAIKG